nr:hypothetical protein CFP56_03876 [Quercus suber]
MPGAPGALGSERRSGPFGVCRHCDGVEKKQPDIKSDATSRSKVVETESRHDSLGAVRENTLRGNGRHIHDVILS